MKLAISRGDVKADRMSDQRFIVIGHGKIAEDECLFRIVGSFETENEAERAAKRAFEMDFVDPSTKRFDYVVARQFTWHNFPIDFAQHVEKTIVDSNKELEDYYKGEMYKKSDEYKASVRNIEEVSKSMQEEHTQTDGALQTAEKNSVAISTTDGGTI